MTTIKKETHILFYINFSVNVIEKYDHVQTRSVKVYIKSLILVSTKADLQWNFVCKHFNLFQCLFFMNIGFFLGRSKHGIIVGEHEL